MLVDDDDALCLYFNRRMEGRGWVRAVGISRWKSHPRVLPSEELGRGNVIIPAGSDSEFCSGKNRFG